MKARLFILAASTALGLVLSAPANASGCGICPQCDPPGSADKAGARTTQTLNTRIDNMERTVVEAIKGSTKQLTSAIRTLSVSIGKVIDAQTQNQAQIAREQSESQVNRDYTPSVNACRTVNTVRNGATALAVAGRARQQLNTSAHNWAAAAPTTPAAHGRDAAAAAVFGQFARLYCSPGSPYCNTPSQLPDADIKIGETLYQQDTFPDQQHQQAAVDLVRMLTAPIPQLPPRAPGNDKEQQEQVLLWRRFVAWLNTVLDALNASVADRTPAVDSTAFREVLEAARIPLNQPLPAQISRKELIALSVTSRFDNPQWYADLYNAEPAELQRIAIHIQALNAELLRRIDDKLERQTGVLATMQAHQLDVNPPKKYVPKAQ